MRWFVVNKRAAPAPRQGTYKDWKPQLRAEGRLQCVYCAIHEASFGGERNFHIEHFKPKSRFPLYRDAYWNLFYACAICNTFKGNHWPGSVGPLLARIGFIDPSAVDYCEVFSADAEGILSARKLAGRYMTSRLYLNRPQLILERRIYLAIETLERIRIKLDDQVRRALQCKPLTQRLLALVQSAYALTSTINQLYAEARKLSPYEPEDISRPKSVRPRAARRS